MKLKSDYVAAQQGQGEVKRWIDGVMDGQTDTRPARSLCSGI